MKRSDLRAVYLNAGMSRREFARHISVPEQSIRRFEDGDGISPANAKRLADYLGCKVTDLLDDDESIAVAS